MFVDKCLNINVYFISVSRFITFVTSNKHSIANDFFVLELTVIKSC